MKRVTLHAILAFFTLFAFGPALHAAETSPAATDDMQTAADEEPRPVAVVDEPIFDAGRVSRGEEIVHDFVIRNTGDAPLQISDVRPTCGCTVAEYDETIPPGGSGQVHAVLDTTTEEGGISKPITILTNDPANPRLIVTIKALVLPNVFVRPGFARFIQPKMSDPGEVKQIVFTDTFDDLRVLEAESPYPFLEVTSHPAGEGERYENGSGRQWVVTMTMDYEKAPLGALADFVTLTLNHPNQTKLEIPVSGFVRPMVVVNPPEASFDQVELGGDEPPFGTLIVKNYAQDAMTIEAGEVTVPGIDLSVEEVAPGREYHVRVTLTDDLPEGPFRGTIHLKTNLLKVPTVEVPLSGERL